MKSKLLIVLALAAFTSCGGFTTKKTAETRVDTPDMHNAANSLDYLGIYSGTLPAADCPGIDTRLVLYRDGTYQLNMQYLERDTGFDEQGTYTVDGNLLTLTPKNDGLAANGGQPAFYKIEEGQLQMLGGDMKVIEGPLAEHYILKKAQ